MRGFTAYDASVHSSIKITHSRGPCCSRLRARWRAKEVDCCTQLLRNKEGATMAAAMVTMMMMLLCFSAAENLCFAWPLRANASRFHTKIWVLVLCKNKKKRILRSLRFTDGRCFRVSSTRSTRAVRETRQERGCCLLSQVLTLHNWSDQGRHVVLHWCCTGFAGCVHV